jgi:hypothetical protein
MYITATTADETRVNGASMVHDGNVAAHEVKNANIFNGGAAWSTSHLYRGLSLSS